MFKILVEKCFKVSLKYVQNIGRKMFIKSQMATLFKNGLFLGSKWYFAAQSS